MNKWYDLRTCNTHGRDGKYVSDYGQNLKGRRPLVRRRHRWKVKLKWILNKYFVSVWICFYCLRLVSTGVNSIKLVRMMEFSGL
jgi:hypothetical protein